MSTPLNNPHDRLFKKLMSDLKIAREFLEIHLPNPIKAQCDFTTLQVAPGSYIEDNLKQHYSDILYRLEIAGKPGYIYFLIEHISQGKRLTPFQVLRYQVAAMHQHLEAGHTRLPVILPLIFYRGEKSPYPYSLDILDCFEDRDLAKQIWGKPPHLIDLSVIPDEELKNHHSVALLELLQKHIRLRDLNALIKEYLFNESLYIYLSPEQFRSVLEYLAQAGHSADYEALSQLVTAPHRALKSEYQTIMQTFSDYLLDKGHQQGLQQGHKQGHKQGHQQGLHEGEYRKALMIASNMLAQGCDLALIKRVTGLADEDLDSLLPLSS